MVENTHSKPSSNFVNKIALKNNLWYLIYFNKIELQNARIRHYLRI